MKYDRMTKDMEDVVKELTCRFKICLNLCYCDTSPLYFKLQHVKLGLKERYFNERETSLGSLLRNILVL